MTAAHSYWSASRFEQRMLCAGSAVLEAGAPDNSNAYAAEGTAAHQVLTWALQQDHDARHYLGMYIYLDRAGRVQDDELDHVYGFMVDDDMARHVQVCIDYVRDVAGDNPIIADTRVNYARYLDVEEDAAWGTADVIILLPDEIVVVDFKYGMGVEVSAEGNPQMSLYGLGALAEYRDFAEFARARLVISQPRLTVKPSEYDLLIGDLEAWGFNDARLAVQACQAAEELFEAEERKFWDKTYLVPGEKQCKFCKAKATCPALRAEVAGATVGHDVATPDEFAEAVVQAPLEDVQWLSVSLAKVDLIEDWCKAIRATVEGLLFSGSEVPGFKLVQGKRGARAWSSAATAEATLKGMRLKTEEMYDFKLISPTSAEKLAKANVIGPRQWPKVLALITQPDGKAHVAPVSDPRPAMVVTPVIDDFTDATLTPAAQGAWDR